MCKDCGNLVRLMELTRHFRGSRVEYVMTVPGNNGTRLIGADGRENSSLGN
jgi:hypothetical protein